MDLEYLREYDKTTQTIQCYIWHLYMYDPIEDSWTEKAKIPFFSPNQARDVVFVAVDDKLMIFGTFYTNPTLTLTNNQRESKILSYNPETDKWTQIDTSANVSSHVVGVASGFYAPQKIYFFRITECTDVYDPIDNTWSTAEPIPVAMRKSCSVCVVNDVFYVIGTGINPVGTGGGTYWTGGANLQYIPIGYNGTLPSTDNPSYLDRISSNFTIIVIVVIALTVSIIGASLIYCRSKK